MEINSTYRHLFERYGVLGNSAEVKTSYRPLYRPDKIEDFAGVERYDKNAAELIAELKHLQTALVAYRQDLVKRYNELATMASRERISLKRRRTYEGAVRYTLSVYTVYEDGTESFRGCKNYSGRERHAAIAEFERLCAEHRNAEAVKDIAVPEWERR